MRIAPGYIHAIRLRRQPAVNHLPTTGNQVECSDQAEAALDGQPKSYFADIISGKVAGPYKPKGGWRVR